MSKAARRSIADLVQAGETKGQGATVTPIAPTAQPEKKPATRKQTTLYLEPAVMRQLKELESTN